MSKLVNAFEANDGKSMIVCGAGSAGVEEAELPRDIGNHFAIYRLQPGRRTTGAPFVEVEWFELKRNAGAEWTSAGSWQISG